MRAAVAQGWAMINTEKTICSLPQCDCRLWIAGFFAINYCSSQEARFISELWWSHAAMTTYNESNLINWWRFIIMFEFVHSLHEHMYLPPTIPLESILILKYILKPFCAQNLYPNLIWLNYLSNGSSFVQVPMTTTFEWRKALENKRWGWCDSSKDRRMIEAPVCTNILFFC